MLQVSYTSHQDLIENRLSFYFFKNNFTLLNNVLNFQNIDNILIFNNESNSNCIVYSIKNIEKLVIS